MTKHARSEREDERSGAGHTEQRARDCQEGRGAEMNGWSRSAEFGYQIEFLMRAQPSAAQHGGQEPPENSELSGGPAFSLRSTLPERPCFLRVHSSVVHSLDLDATRCEQHIKLPVLADGKRSEEHTSELQSRRDLVCRLLLEKKKQQKQRQRKQPNMISEDDIDT